MTWLDSGGQRSEVKVTAGRDEGIHLLVFIWNFRRQVLKQINKDWRIILEKHSTNISFINA